MTLEKELYYPKLGEPDLELVIIEEKARRSIIYYVQKLPNKIKVYSENLLDNSEEETEEQGYTEIKDSDKIREVMRTYFKEKLLERKGFEKAYQESLNWKKRKPRKTAVILRKDDKYKIKERKRN